MGEVQSNTTCNIYLQKNFTEFVSTTTCFGLYIAHNKVEHLPIIRQTIHCTVFL